MKKKVFGFKSPDIFTGAPVAYFIDQVERNEMRAPKGKLRRYGADHPLGRNFMSGVKIDKISDSFLVTFFEKSNSDKEENHQVSGSLRQ